MIRVRNFMFASALYTAFAIMTTGLISCKKTASTSNDVVKIGLLTDVTGDFSSYGTQAVIGAKLAVDEINEAGGINGKKVQLIQYDTQTDNTVYQEMARKVCLEDKANVVLAGVSSASREAIRPILEENETIYFYNQEYEGGVASHYVFCTGPIPEMQIDPTVDYLMETQCPKARVYIIAADYNFGQISAQWAVKAVERNGGTVIHTEFIPLGVSQFSSTIANINAAKPDMIISFCTGAAHMSFYEQWSNSKFADIPIVTTCALAINGEHKLFAPPTMYNVYVGAPYYEEVPTAAAKSFTAKLKERNPSVKYIGWDAETNYTAIYLYKLAVEKAGTTDTEAVISALESGITFDGPGGKATINGKDHHTIRDISVGKVDKNNTLSVIKTFYGVKSNFIENLGIDLSKEGKNAPNKQYTPNGN